MKTIDYLKSNGSFKIQYLDNYDIIDATINVDSNSISVDAPITKAVMENNEGDRVNFKVGKDEIKILILEKKINIFYKKIDEENFLSKPYFWNSYEKKDFVNISHVSDLDCKNIYFLFYYKPAEHKESETISFKLINAFKKKSYYEDQFDSCQKKDYNFMLNVFKKNFIKKFNINTSNYIFCMVPSHFASKINNNALSSLIENVAYRHPKSNGSQLLLRHSTIEEQKRSLIRNESVHLSSIGVSKPSFIKDKKVILIDDITTSGVSLKACKKILMDGGAKEVIMFGFGRA